MEIQSYIRSGLIIIGLLLLQTTFLPFISIGGFLPDLLILYLVCIALRNGQIKTTIFGFLIGLMQDIISIKFLGLLALSKTVAGFILGFFYNENTMEQTLGSYRYILLIGLCSVIQDVIYFAFFFQGSEGSILLQMFQMTSGMTLYTCVIGILPMFFFSRKYNVSWAH